MAELAFQVNQSTQNIAHRLHTILERVLEDIAFDAPDRARSTSWSTRRRPSRPTARRALSGTGL